MWNLLSKAKEIFITEEDQKTLSNIEQQAMDLEDIRITMDSDGGKRLKKMLVNDFFNALDKLIETRDDRYISDLKSIMNFINKLNVNQDLDDIRQFLEDKLK